MYFLQTILPILTFMQVSFRTWITGDWSQMLFFLWRPSPEGFFPLRFDRVDGNWELKWSGSGGGVSFLWRGIGEDGDGTDGISLHDSDLSSRFIAKLGKVFLKSSQDPGSLSLFFSLKSWYFPDDSWSRLEESLLLRSRSSPRIYKTDKNLLRIWLCSNHGRIVE